MFKSSLLALLLFSTASGAFAQAPKAAATPAATQAAAASKLTPTQKAQMEKQNAQMAQASLQVATLVDQNKIGEVWDGASAIAKQATTRADFVSRISADRAQLGTLTSRKLMAITRTQSKGGKVPAGNYVNVNYSTQFSKAKQPVRELISYHLDTDNTWRIAGYTVR
ncbi:MAG: DUF4019 domain-containing protein [Rhodanobacter sp.]